MNIFLGVSQRHSEPESVITNGSVISKPPSFNHKAGMK